MNEPIDQPAPKPAQGGRVFDVMRPGRAPASPTSRPGVSAHKPQAQAAQVSVSGVGARQIMDSHEKIAITPPASADGQAPSAPNVGWLPHNGAGDIPEKNPATLAEAPKTTTFVDSVASSQPAAQPSVIGDSHDPLHDTAAPDLGDSTEAVVSHHKSGASWHTWLLIIVILLLAVAVADILLDAEILKFSGVPHTNFL